MKLKFFCLPDGTGYAAGMEVPPGTLQCAERPGAEYVFTGTVSPNPSIMWRLRTAEEQLQQAEDNAGVKFDSDKDLLAFAIVMLNEINALRAAAGLPARTPAQLRTAFMTARRAL